jgi:hypothetical protein
LYGRPKTTTKTHRTGENNPNIDRKAQKQTEKAKQQKKRAKAAE